MTLRGKTCLDDDYARMRFNRALLDCGVDAKIFSRLYGTMARGRWCKPDSPCAKRLRVWLAMREPDERGIVPSYPTMARACGLTNHSTIITAVWQHKQRQIEALSTPEQSTARAR